MDNILIIPIVLPLLFAVAIVTVCRTLWRLRGYSIVACGLNILVALVLLYRTWNGEILVLRLGNWPAPFGIVMVADMLASLMIATTTLLALLITIFAQRGLHERRERRFFHPLTQFLVMGVNMSLLSGDLFNLFVSFEVMLIASYAMLSLGVSRRFLKPVWMYLVLNVFAGIVFLFAAGMAYGLLGTLNLADMAVKIQELPPSQHGKLLVIVMMLLFVFGSKAAMFPLFFWLPHSYGVLAAPILALFAGMLTKVGIYAMIRVLCGTFGPAFEAIQPFVLTLAGLTMVLGVVGAVGQSTIRRILSFHIVSQIGYMIMGAALLTPYTVAGAIFFMLHNMLVKTGLLLVGGIVEMRKGTDELARLGGLWRSDPALSVMFFLLAMSLAGLPPLTGFWGKLMLIESGFAVGAYGIVAVSILTSVLTLFSMLKIWNYAFWRSEPTAEDLEKLGPPPPQGSPLPQPASRQVFALLTLVVLATALGFFPERLVQATRMAGFEVFEEAHYYEHIIESQDGDQSIWGEREIRYPEKMVPEEAPLDEPVTRARGFHRAEESAG